MRKLIALLLGAAALSPAMAQTDAVNVDPADWPRYARDWGGTRYSPLDEIDTGISGRIATKVGAAMRNLADFHQIIAITHLPQIAAYGTTHFRIVKSVRGGRTVTDVARVAGRDREEELARMIGGADVSAAVLTSAREMLSSRHKAKGEYKAKGESESRR